MLITLGLSQNMDDSTSTGKLVNVEELLLLNAYYNLSQQKNNPHSLHKHITCIPYVKGGTVTVECFTRTQYFDPHFKTY